MNRALLIGINTYPSSPLNGCVNDISDMAKFLTEKCQFAMDDVRLLANDRATKKNIIERLNWLLKDLKSGDRIVFHYSGHGVRLPTRNKKGEVDGLDEAICPYDFDWTEDHTIRDKEFAQIFSTIPEGVEFIWISDSCHSGDLERALVKESGKKKTINLPVDIEWRLQTAKQKKIDTAMLTKSAQHLHLALISGCKSNQTSADAMFKKRYNGALTYFLLGELNKTGGLTKPLTQIVKDVNVALKKKGFSQISTIDGCSRIMKKPFLTL